MHAAVARSAFSSQNAQNTPTSTFGSWDVEKLGAKHIFKSKCTKQTMFGPLLEVRMSKNDTPLWREAHFEVKMHKTPAFGSTFQGPGVEIVRQMRKVSQFVGLVI